MYVLIRWQKDTGRRRGQQDAGTKGILGQKDTGTKGIRRQKDTGIKGIRGQKHTGTKGIRDKRIRWRKDTGTKGIRDKGDTGPKGHGDKRDTTRYIGIYTYSDIYICFVMKSIYIIWKDLQRVNTELDTFYKSVAAGVWLYPSNYIYTSAELLVHTAALHCKLHLIQLLA